MPRKAIGKTVTRLSRSEIRSDETFAKKKYQFLASLKYTNVTSVLLPGDDKPTDFIEFTFASLKKLLKQHEQNAIAAIEAAEAQERLASKKLRSASTKLAKADVALKKSKEAAQQLRERAEALELVKMEREEQISELQEKLQSLMDEESLLQQNYNRLLKNIDEEPEQTHRPNGLQSPDWSGITNRKPVPGGYKTGKRG
ncbi:hypothetical protein [Pseudomonas sp. UMAB-08]|uniref:hypothetical protein n=1 Tax=Pseudomonas sp. UMAB-08 TaxID=1365375 RepID=UPI001C58E839|nr:hypothetical protein [Pseudomonas sp. UMAB-08]